MHVWVCACYGAMWKSEDCLWELVPSFHHVGPRVWIQVVKSRLAVYIFYLWSDLSGLSNLISAEVLNPNLSIIMKATSPATQLDLGVAHTERKGARTDLFYRLLWSDSFLRCLHLCCGLPAPL